MSSKTILITGAAGNIGSALAKKCLELGHKVWGIDDLSTGDADRIPYGVPCQALDLAQSDIPNFPTDIVIHCAALADIVPSIKDPQKYHDANVTGTVRLLEWARRKKTKPRFIYAASSSCYGDNPNYPTTELEPTNPKYPYALTKLIGEQYVMHYAEVYGIPAISLRLFNVYGPGFKTRGAYGAVFGVFLAQLANNKPLTVVGDGTQRRDFTHVDDVCRAFIAAMESSKTKEIYNVGSGMPLSVNMLVELLGNPLTVNIPKRPGEPDITWANTTKITRDLAWQPFVNPREGVASMLKNIKDYIDAPVWTKESINETTKEWFQCLKKY
jgi:UDP-glucose 4-epimerase